MKSLWKLSENCLKTSGMVWKTFWKTLRNSLKTWLRMVVKTYLQTFWNSNVMHKTLFRNDIPKMPYGFRVGVSAILSQWLLRMRLKRSRVSLKIHQWNTFFQRKLQKFGLADALIQCYRYDAAVWRRPNIMRISP